MAGTTDTAVLVPDLSDAGLRRVTDALAELAEENDRTARFPWASIQVVHDAGLLTYGVSPELGGAVEPTIADAVRIMQAIGHGDASVALLAAMTIAQHLVHGAADVFPADLYARIVADSAQRPVLLNAIRAEPELGAPARGGLPRTTITRTADGWVLNGDKAYATGGTGLAYHVVWAVAQEPGGDPERPRVGHVIVPGDLPGITWIDTWDHLGLRASNTHDVSYRDVELPLDAFSEIPRGADGVYRDPAAAAGPRSFAHPALYIGVARAARSAFAAFARSRVPAALGKPIAQTERIQSVAGEVDLQIVQAETLLYGALLRLEAGDTSVLPELSAVKVAIARSVIAATQTAVAAIGNPGLSRHHSLERHLRDALCIRVHPPQEDTVLIWSGRRVLGV
jgi:alkylation response protein AidB-like acyl-CoA dehydrogenase